MSHITQYYNPIGESDATRFRGREAGFPQLWKPVADVPFRDPVGTHPFLRRDRLARGKWWSTAR